MKHFDVEIREGKAIGAQRRLAKNLKKVFEILDNIDGLGNVSIVKDGTNWRIKSVSQKPETPPQSGIPAGYEEKEVHMVLDGKIMRCTVLMKANVSGGTTYQEDLVTWDSSDNRKLLQVGTNGTLLVDKGYLKS